MDILDIYVNKCFLKMQTYWLRLFGSHSSEVFWPIKDTAHQIFHFLFFDDENYYYSTVSEIKF